ncbi:unnamed protein product [Moneuplotes crassus]|uniref:Uncharacterized protein n=1 Tax=Euplotes crassus TaxID=5936 RepID=A0AAD1U7B3_EUPCR|nr:unnamed protein product [Moneuplotes crassus]
MFNIFSDFCLCDLQIQLQRVPPPMPAASKVPIKCHKQITTIHKYDFSRHQEKLKQKLFCILGTGLPFVLAKKKASISSNKKISKRRTRFTGVTKNSLNYQTLIVVGGKKTYVGSYPLEVDAAITFDFYSMMLHNDMAPTNFSWRAEDVFEMLESFNQNEGVFEASLFRHKVF